MTTIFADDSKDDAESIHVMPDVSGGPVDSAGGQRSLYEMIMSRRGDKRPPIIPQWLRDAHQRRMVIRWSTGYLRYCVGYRLSHAPLCAVKMMWYAPIGAWRIVWRTLRWASAEEGNLPLRKHAILRNHSEEWRKLDQIRERQSTWRWWVVAFSVVACIVPLAFVLSGPWWMRWVLLGVVLPVLARVGRPAEKPILDQIQATDRFVKLTAEMVRTALCRIGLAGVKDPAEIRFPTEIHRDGPGYLARVDLPPGTEAVEVLDRRGRLSSALRLPVDQVWPAAGKAHAGRLDLWVGYEPASKMGQPTWALCSPNARTSVFEPAPFGTDERQRPVETRLFELNFLIGGQPGSGKSFGARTLAMIAMLDPTCELKIAEFKGVGDFLDLEPLCSTYICGVDDDAFDKGADLIEWGLAEAERRGTRIRQATARGEAPQRKVTPELAARPGSGLHPILILIDEGHELLGARKEAADGLERFIKRSRALAIFVVFATQVADAKSVPTGITKCVSTRWCMSVLDWSANDQILGSGAYRRGLTGTQFVPGDDAGWGIMTGVGKPGPVRGFYPSEEQAKSIIARAIALRGGMVVGGTDQLQSRDVLADVITVMRGDRGLHWPVLAARLAELDSSYHHITGDAISARLRSLGVPSVGVKIDGVNRNGLRRDDLLRAIGGQEKPDEDQK